MSLELTIINSMLSTTGTANLTAEDTSHPNYVTAKALLREVIQEFSSKPLWFNTTYRTLQPNTEGRIIVPSNALSCDPVDAALDYCVRGQYLFDNGNYTNVIGTAVDVIIVAEIPIEDMPPIVIQFIRKKARLEYFVDQDGSANKVKLYADEFYRTERDLVIMNMKHTGANFFKGKAYASFTTRRSAFATPFTRIQ
jgi:hypothetical protein